MSRSLIATAVAALAFASTAAAGPPKRGTLVPGHSLGGVRLGESRNAVRTALGGFFGACRGCARPTWYFTYRPFARRGLAVEFESGRVSAVYTLWRPPGWYAPHRLALGATPLEVHRRAGATRTVVCSDYTALVRDSAGGRTAYYVFRGRLWGFGLFRRGAAPCR